MTDEPVYQWQHKRNGASVWEDMPDPHPNSLLARSFPHPVHAGEVYDDGMGNLYRHVLVEP